jgi:hypothetical protein
MIRGPSIPGLAVCLLLLAGCHPVPQQVGQSDDPLIGGRVPNAAPAGTAAPAQGAVTADNGPLPPFPAPTGSNSIAVLAGGGVKQDLDPGTQLRIGGTPVSQQIPDQIQPYPPIPIQPVDHTLPPVGPDSGSNGFPAPGDDSPIMLHPPIAADPPNSPQAANPPSSPPSLIPQPAAYPATIPAAEPPPVSEYAQVIEQLRAHGATWSQEPQQIGATDQWLFICSVPNPSDPTAVDRIHAIASGGRGLAAVRKALAEITGSP